LNASRNHTLTLIGPAVTDHDNALMSEVVTKQDLYNVGVLIDSNFKSLAGDIHNLRTDMDAQFVRVDSQFARVASEFVAVRSEMRSLLTTFKDEINKTTMRTGFATFLAVVALLGIERWWN
jgi:hypothetical protein